MKISEAITFANDRPMSLDDDLYQWAVDAEELIRKQADVIEMAYRLAMKFKTKVENGQAKSVETYDDCNNLVKVIHKDYL